MKTDMDQCTEVLQNAVRECESQWIALSGGLDSSILAHLRKDLKPQAITIITKDFLGTDLTFAQIIAKHTGLPLSLMQVTMEEVLDSINETIKILDNFNDIEIRNSIVPHLYLNSLKKKGVDSVITGDPELIKKLSAEKQVSEMIDEIAVDLSSDMAYSPSSLSKFIGLCNYIKTSLLICDIHHNLESDIDEAICKECENMLLKGPGSVY
ncbi:asparagine synthase C-terminal domain-containing protein [Candidatus Nitrosopelagicus sp.]|nr:asparagine synthase C-terminal domain-containing protein [Candidatus Nitrosopelagicus sp.]